MTNKTRTRSPWWWVPSLYYAQGIPYAVVMLISVIFYKRMGISNTDIALYTSWLYLPWVIKPLWSPVVDILKTKRWWIVITQLIIGAGLGGVALSIPMPGFFKVTLGFFWLLAFSSATHDIAADGFYMLGLNQHQQAWFVGIRSTFYRIAMITGQGLLIIFAGYVEDHTGLETATLQVEAAQQPGIVEYQPDTDTTSMRIILDPPVVSLALTERQKSELESDLQLVEKWNRAHGQDVPETGGNNHGNGKPDEPASGWKSRLEDFLRRTFGETVEGGNTDLTGNYTLVKMRLSHPPEEGETVVNFGRVSGDKSLSLITPPRFVFTKENWNKPVLMIIQVDHRQKTPVMARFEARSGNITLAWTLTFIIIGALFILFFLYHHRMLPFPANDIPVVHTSSFWGNFVETFGSYFTKDRIAIMVAFILIYRFGEAQLVKLATPFLLDAQEAGGLALSTGQVGFVYGTVGMIMLTLGGILGGILAARHGLRYWFIWMALAMKLPDAVYVFLSYAQPDSFFIVNVCVAVEQFGYGFGFTAYM
ncbi:MAG: MFS transporter, partial [Fidelibacterota bacterium]